MMADNEIWLKRLKNDVNRRHDMDQFQWPLFTNKGFEDTLITLKKKHIHYSI